jgi:hypothetical protein
MLRAGWEMTERGKIASQAVEARGEAVSSEEHLHLGF